MTDIEKLAEILSKSRHAVFFGGAGMSTESGIPDFRSANGIYNQKLNKTFSPEEMASHNFFLSHPEEFFAFYRERFVYLNAKPNAGHLALAELEQKGILSAVITQNIDGLHQIAGSKVVYELHGSVLRNYCMKCRKFYGLDAINGSKGVPKCTCGGIIKPDVVLYEEGLDDKTVHGAVKAISKADVLIIGGTSLNVYPAAGFLAYFNGSKIVLLNKSETSYDSKADIVIRDPIGQVLGECVLE